MIHAMARLRWHIPSLKEIGNGVLNEASAEPGNEVSAET